MEQMEVKAGPAALALKDLVDVHDVVAAFARPKKPGRRRRRGLRWDFHFRLPNGDGTLHKRGTTLSGWKLLAGEEATGAWREGAVSWPAFRRESLPALRCETRIPAAPLGFRSRRREQR